jgi:hypothetical protein
MSVRPRLLKTVRATLAVCLFALASSPCRASDEPQPEKLLPYETKGEHFIVYTQQEDAQVREILRRAEIYYRGIAERLNFPRRSEFWLWNDRVKIYLYAQKADYTSRTQEPEWSQGVTDYATKEISSFVMSEGFMDSVLPHEIAHLIFQDFYGAESSESPPDWLDEGVAQWAEDQETKRILKDRASGLLEDKGLLSLTDIFLVNLSFIKKNPNRLCFRLIRSKKDRYSVIILSPDVLIDTFYVESGSLVGYLIETLGIFRFAEFCRELSRDKTVQEALEEAYPKQFQSVEDLDDQWRAYLLKKNSRTSA